MPKGKATDLTEYTDQIFVFLIREIRVIRGSLF